MLMYLLGFRFMKIEKSMEVGKSKSGGKCIDKWKKIVKVRRRCKRKTNY